MGCKLKYTRQAEKDARLLENAGLDKAAAKLLSIIKETASNMIYSLLRESEDSQAGFPDALYFAARKDNVEYPNISYQSDGICGDMIARDEGWYEMFSKYFEPDDRLWYS